MPILKDGKLSLEDAMDMCSVKVAKPSAAAGAEYPKMLFHPSEEPRIVADADEELQLLESDPGWRPRPQP